MGTRVCLEGARTPASTLRHNCNQMVQSTRDWKQWEGCQRKELKRQFPWQMLAPEMSAYFILEPWICLWSLRIESLPTFSLPMVFLCVSYLFSCFLFSLSTFLLTQSKMIDKLEARGRRILLSSSPFTGLRQDCHYKFRPYREDPDYVYATSANNLCRYLSFVQEKAQSTRSPIKIKYVVNQAWLHFSQCFFFHNIHRMYLWTATIWIHIQKAKQKAAEKITFPFGLFDWGTYWLEKLRK